MHAQVPKHKRQNIRRRKGRKSSFWFSNEPWGKILFHLLFQILHHSGLRRSSITSFKSLLGLVEVIDELLSVLEEGDLSKLVAAERSRERTVENSTLTADAKQVGQQG